VQGVGFRYHVDGVARDFAVSGTVRNLPSGGVEIDAEGEKESVDAFVERVLKEPPRHARVSRVTRTTAEPRGLRGFRVSG
jgi:acylphosphatase